MRVTVATVGAVARVVTADRRRVAVGLAIVGQDRVAADRQNQDRRDKGDEGDRQARPERYGPEFLLARLPYPA
jgi:hypothetical protein